MKTSPVPPPLCVYSRRSLSSIWKPGTNVFTVLMQSNLFFSLLSTSSLTSIVKLLIEPFRWQTEKSGKTYQICDYICKAESSSCKDLIKQYLPQRGIFFFTMYNKTLFWPGVLQSMLPTSMCDLACVTSVSARVRRESWDESKKKKRNEGGGGRERSDLLP